MTSEEAEAERLELAEKKRLRKEAAKLRAAERKQKKDATARMLNDLAVIYT